MKIETHTKNNYLLLSLPVIVIIAGISLYTEKLERPFYSKSDYHFNLINKSANKAALSIERQSAINQFRKSFSR